MKAAFTTLLGVAFVFAAVAAISAADDKVTLKGTITCAKCDLKKQKTCQTVIVTKEKDKEVIYYFDKDSNKKYHGDTCKAAKMGTVTGTTSEKGGKKMISVSEVKYD